MRSLDDVTDDEIVDAVASFGIRGAACALEEFDSYDVAEVVLERLCVDVDGVVDDEVLYALEERYRKLGGRVAEDGQDVFYMLTSEEWGRRLAGKSAEEITAALKGSA